MYLKNSVPFAHLDDSWQFHVWLQPSSDNHSKSFMFCKAADCDNQSDWKIKGNFCSVDSGCFESIMGAIITLFLHDVWNILELQVFEHVDSSRRGMKKSMLLSITSGKRHRPWKSRGNSLWSLVWGITSCHVLENGLTTSSKNPCPFERLTWGGIVFGAMNQHIHWKFNDRTSSNISPWNMVHAKMINHFSSSNQPSDQWPTISSRERLDFPQRKAVGGMAQNILVKAGFHQPWWWREARSPWGVGWWVGFGRFRSQRRRQRVKETWRSQWRDCYPAPPGMYKTT